MRDAACSPARDGCDGDVEASSLPPCPSVDGGGDGEQDQRRKKKKSSPAFRSFLFFFSPLLRRAAKNERNFPSPAFSRRDERRCLLFFFPSSPRCRLAGSAAERFDVLSFAISRRARSRVSSVGFAAAVRLFPSPPVGFWSGRCP